MIGWITWHRGILPRGFKRSTKGFMAYKGHKGYIRCHMNDQILAQLTKHVIRPSCIHLRTRTGQMGCSRGHKCSWFSSLQKKNPFHETNCKKWHEFSKHFKTQYEARLSCFCYGSLPLRNHILDPLVDRPTQLNYISDVYLLSPKELYTSWCTWSAGFFSDMYKYLYSWYKIMIVMMLWPL